jgi:hypothetical protein
MFELRAGTASGPRIDTADTLREALALAKFYGEDPRDAQAPPVVFIYDAEAAQFAGWFRRRVRKAG